MKLFELFERGEKTPLSPEETRLKTILSVLSTQMRKNKLPSVLKWARVEHVLDKSGVPFSADQVRSYLEKDFSDKLMMNDRGDIESVEPGEVAPDMDMPDQGDLDLDLSPEPTAAAPAVDDAAQEPPVTDVNVTDQMAKRALKRRMG